MEYIKNAVTLTLLIGLLSTTALGQTDNVPSESNEQTDTDTNTIEDEQCICTPYYNCIHYDHTGLHGEGAIDVRINLGPCQSYMEVCCNDTIDRLVDNYITSISDNVKSEIDDRNDPNVGVKNGIVNNNSSENNYTIENSYTNVNSNKTDNNIEQNLICTCVDEKTKYTTQAYVKNYTGQITISNFSFKFKESTNNHITTTDSESLPSTKNSNKNTSSTTCTNETKVHNNATDPSYHGETRCGIWNKHGVGFKVVNAIDGESQYGEYPSMVAIFTEEELENGEKKLMYQCGGSLIKTNVVLTATHCVFKKLNSTFIVRAGEWDLKTEKEIYPHQDRRVLKIVTHEKFYSAALFNDVALLFTEEPFILQKHVQLICLPEAKDKYDHESCFSSGWGKIVNHNNYTIVRKTEMGTSKEIGQYEVNVLKNVELPIVPRDKCINALRTTRLGPKFILHDSFICAGGVIGKDTCRGDGGSPLMCPSKSDPNYLVQVGIVAWGIACGLENVPGVYVDVASFRNWIDSEIENYHKTQ